MEREIFINGRPVGEGHPAYIIAEMSANHAGSIERAKEIIRAAKDSGADCIKIQTYTPDTITIDCHNKYFQIEQGTWEGENLYSLYGKAYTPWEWQEELRDEAKRVGIDFLSTPFDKTSVDFLEKLDLQFYKIASFEMVDLPLLQYIASKGKPIIMSTGMGTEAEIKEAIDTIFATGNHQLMILKCSSAYPANPADMHLSTIADMKERFGIQVGLSDHSMGSLSATTAVALGASVIEKHFCISREIENPDASFSMTPAEFKQMVEDIRKVEAALGVPQYGPSEQEKSNVGFRRSIFVVKDIKAGEPFTEENIRVIRPGYGLMPREFEGVLGKVCICDVERGMPLTADMVKDYMVLSPATEKDCEMTFHWANDPYTREQSFSTEPIGWETHCRWFEQSLKMENRKIYIAYHNEKPVGIFRLDTEGAVGCISYSIAPQVRCRGYGKQLILCAEALVREKMSEIKTLCAEVKVGNIPSKRLFETCGFQIVKSDADKLCFEKSL